MPLDPDRRLMRVTGLDRDPRPDIAAMTDADLLDLLARAAEVRTRRRDGAMAGDLTGASAPARPMGAP